MSAQGNSPKSILAAGSRGGYQWLTTEVEMIPFLKQYPRVVMGKYVAVTSVDSGILTVREQERAKGWESRDGIGYSPKISSLQDLPLTALAGCHYHEWFAFGARSDLGRLSRDNVYVGHFVEPLGDGLVVAFVNYEYFRMHDPQDPSLLSLFWQQLERMEPESYIADSDDFLTFVCRDKALFVEIHSSLAKRGKESQPD